MWEVIAFVLFGFVMARVGAVVAMGRTVKIGYIHDGEHLYRVTKVEDEN